MGMHGQFGSSPAPRSSCLPSSPPLPWEAFWSSKCWALRSPWRCSLTLQLCGWWSGRHSCNLPAIGIGGPLVFMGPRQRLKRSLCQDGKHRGCSRDSVGPCNSLVKRCGFFHFLSLSAGLADIKVFAPKLCLCRACFHYKNRGAGLALQLCLHLRRGPGAADLPQPIVNEFLLLSRPPKRIHHMQREQNA